MTVATDTARFRVYMAQGLGTAEIASQTGWTLRKIRDLRERIVAEEEQDLVGRRSADVFVEYVAQSRRNVQQLEDLLDEFRKCNQPTALVGAVKAKQDILDRVIRLGQSLGLIDKRAERHEHAILIANMSDLELQKHLAAQLSQVVSLARDNASTHFSQVVEATGDGITRIAARPGAGPKPVPRARENPTQSIDSKGKVPDRRSGARAAIRRRRTVGNAPPGRAYS